VLDVEEWAELRRLHFVKGISIRGLQRRTGLDRKTIRRALRAEAPPRYERPARASKLDPFKDEVHRLLREDPTLPATRVREEIEALGFDGRQTIVDVYVRELRPLFAPPPRSFQRTHYRPGELCQFDLWRPAKEIPVGFGQTRPGYVVIACLGYSRVGAGALVFSKEAPDLLWGIARCLWRLGALPRTLVWDREGALHAGGGRPSHELAALCGRLKLGWWLCEPGDPQAKGVVERLQGYVETSFEPGRRFASPRHFQDELDRWFEARANVRHHRSLRCRPCDRLPEEHAAMAPLPAEAPDTDRRWVARVAPDPHVRVDTNDYSLDPRLVGDRVELRVSQTEVSALALDTGELACRHARSFARHRTVTCLEHARALRELRSERRSEPEVETRSLERYDALIPA
jgi:transposase